MPTYVTLITWTDQGVKNFRDTTKRAAEFASQVEAHGGKVRELLWTVGQYDLMTVVDWPDEESSVAALLMTAAAGSVRTNTLRAYSAQEVDGIIARTA